MSFEDALLRNIDKRRAQERREKPRETSPYPALRDAHEKARKMFSDPDYSIQATDFFDLYDRQKVVDDMLRVKQKRMMIERSETSESKEVKKASEVFEAIILEQSELSNWLGGNVSVLKTSLYDDYFNGTDMIAEWNEPGESNVLALAVDVTFGSSGVERKLQHVRRDAENGKLGKIKYFKNADGSFRGERTGVPHAVIGIGRKTVEQLAGLWLHKDKHSLAAHPIQRVLVEEMYMQMRLIREYAQAHGRQKVAEAYDRSLAIIAKVREEKKDMPLAELEHDKVYREIRDQSRIIFAHSY